VPPQPSTTSTSPIFLSGFCPGYVHRCPSKAARSSCLAVGGNEEGGTGGACYEVSLAFETLPTYYLVSSSSLAARPDGFSVGFALSSIPCSSSLLCMYPRFVVVMIVVLGGEGGIILSTLTSIATLKLRFVCEKRVFGVCI